MVRSVVGGSAGGKAGRDHPPKTWSADEQPNRGYRTLYDAFPTRAALFGHTLGVTTVGDEEPAWVADRPEVLAARDEPDPACAIRHTVAYTTALLERAGDLIMLSVEAAGGDPDMWAVADTGARDAPGAPRPHPRAARARRVARRSRAARRR